MVRNLFALLLVSASVTAASAGQPSAVLPHPTLRPSLPISTASASMPASTELGEPCDRQRVMAVDSARAKAIPDGFVLDVYGQSQSAGWKLPQLLVSHEHRGVATVDFVACPSKPGAAVIAPIEAHMALGLDARTTRIIIRSRTNTVTVDISH